MISIRMATVEDAEKISSLLVDLSEEFIVPEFTSAGREYFLDQLSPENMRERFAGEFRFWLAENGIDLAGVAAIRGNAHLYYLFVAKPYQGRGLAKRLWLMVRDECMARGNPGPITVNASIYAATAYEQLGFVRTGPIKEINGVLYVPMEYSINS